MLAAGAFAVVPVADDAPFDAGRFVGLGNGGDGVEGVGQEVEGLAAGGSGFVFIFGVTEGGAFGAGEEVGGDVGEVAAIFVPGARGGDVVCRAFSWKGCCC